MDKRVHIDHFIIVHPKSWDTMIKEDRTLSYDFLSSLKYPNIFVFEYFAPQHMLMLLEQALEKTCLFEFTESDGLGIVHTLIEMCRLRREIDFMDEESFCKSTSL